MLDGIRENCGVAAVFSKKGNGAAGAIVKALYALQHRGQDACGFAVFNKGKISLRKGLGLVSDALSARDLAAKGAFGIGHTRYPTTGTCEMNDVQPYVFENIAMAHNGQIANYEELRAELSRGGAAFTSSVDSEVMVHLASRSMASGKGAKDAISELMGKLDGAYAVAALLDGAIFVFRDPNGIKPMVWGENGDLIVFASESAALDANSVPLKGILGRGQCAEIRDGKITFHDLATGRAPALCMFEHVYFSRPDSVISEHGAVMGVREALGRALAHEHPVAADVVVDVPDTARTAAAAFSAEAGIPHREGLIKNRYVGRTFIMPTQKKRADSVRIKLNAVRYVLEGKRVALIDDSIVRGTTLREIVALVRAAGATEVHVRIPCPPIRAPCFYGIDMSTYKELAANGRSEDEICKMVGADSLRYLSLAGLKSALGNGICTGCLDEAYPTQYAKKLAKERIEVEPRC
jgi:amidophosphoribosyltransferase